MKDENLMWKDKAVLRDVWKGPIFSIDEVVRLNPEGKEQPMVVCRTPDWVTVVPELDGDGEAVPSRQRCHVLRVSRRCG